jgi:hypothetical protein
VILRCVLLRVFLVSDASFRSLLTCDGYLKQNLCTTAAYRPVRELIQQERLKDLVSVFFFYHFNFSNVSRNENFMHHHTLTRMLED